MLGISLWRIIGCEFRKRGIEVAITSKRVFQIVL